MTYLVFTYQTAGRLKTLMVEAQTYADDGEGPEYYLPTAASQVTAHDEVEIIGAGESYVPDCMIGD